MSRSKEFVNTVNEVSRLAQIMPATEVTISKDLFDAIVHAFNQIVNTKLNYKEYKDTYAIASALEKITRS